MSRQSKSLAIHTFYLTKYPNWELNTSCISIRQKNLSLNLLLLSLLFSISHCVSEAAWFCHKHHFIHVNRKLKNKIYRKLFGMFGSSSILHHFLEDISALCEFSSWAYNKTQIYTNICELADSRCNPLGQTVFYVHFTLWTMNSKIESMQSLQ